MVGLLPYIKARLMEARNISNATLSQNRPSLDLHWQGSARNLRNTGYITDAKPSGHWDQADPWQGRLGMHAKVFGHADQAPRRLSVVPSGASISINPQSLRRDAREYSVGAKLQ